MSEITNLHVNPRCGSPRDMVEATSSPNGQKIRYEKLATATAAAVYCWSPLTNAQLQGKVLYARIQSSTQAVSTNLAISNATTLTRDTWWIAAQVADDDTNDHTISLMHGPFVLNEVAVYEPSDWDRVYAAYQRGIIDYPWFAGPRNATMAGEIGPWEL